MNPEIRNRYDNWYSLYRTEYDKKLARMKKQQERQKAMEAKQANSKTQ